MDLNNETMIDKKEKIIIDDGIDRYTNDGQSLEFLQSDDHQCCAVSERKEKKFFPILPF